MGKSRVYITWSKRPDGRLFTFRRNWSVAAVYVQVWRAEVVVWYRKLSAPRQR